MKRSAFFISACCLCLTFSAYGQSTLFPKPTAKTVQKAQNDPKALEVLNKASAAYQKAGGVKAGFTIKVLSKGGNVRDNVSGNIYLKGSKFKIETGDMTTWFDGTNQWVYLPSNNEVNLSRPNSREQLMINPVNVFELYKHGYNCKLLSDKSDKGKKLFQIELKPYTNEAVQSIVVLFEKGSYRPANITIANKDKSGSRIAIGSYITGQSYPEVMFTFQQKAYPNAEVIDLR
jgi:outer membrane lipoprotein-sorting protein